MGAPGEQACELLRSPPPPPPPAVANGTKADAADSPNGAAEDAIDADAALKIEQAALSAPAMQQQPEQQPQQQPSQRQQQPRRQRQQQRQPVVLRVEVATKGQARLLTWSIWGVLLMFVLTAIALQGIRSTTDLKVGEVS